MKLTADELDRRLAAFWNRREAFVALGHDGGRAAALVLDAAGPLEGPVLDLGSGMGVMARELARRGLAVESVDVSAEDQEVAASLTAGSGLETRIRFTTADGAALPFADGTFASAVSFNVLHHLADGASVLRDVVRVVRPGGVLVLADFSAEGFDFAARVHVAEGAVHPEGPVTLDWARGFLAAAGLVETASGEAHHERFAAFHKPAAASRPGALRMGVSSQLRSRRMTGDRKESS
jgi:ubiquinone/menaquinone biosynthesis C-methylase UbiE